MNSTVLAKKLVNTVLKPFGVRLEALSATSIRERKRRVSEALIKALTTPYTGPGKNQAEGIVFSMDRAMQLHALLGSYLESAKHPAKLHILYRATTEAHDKCYQEVLRTYSYLSDINFVSQKSRATFRAQLLAIIAKISAERIFFLVDDDLFIEPFDLGQIAAIDTRYAVPSLRMGANLSGSYTLQEEQPLPRLSRWSGEYSGAAPQAVSPGTGDGNDDLLAWSWEGGLYDWAYPLSVDGHFFTTTEIAALAEHTEFNSPNTFEGNLQAYTDFFGHRLGICYRKSRMVNIPINKVQTDNDNLHGEIHQDELLAKWNEGLRIDYGALRGALNKSAHEELAITFAKRNQSV